MNGKNIVEEPDAHDSISSREVDIWADSNGDIRSNIEISNYRFKEVYSEITPMNVVAPFKGNKSTRELDLNLVLEVQEVKEGLSEEQFSAFGNTLVGMVNSFNGDYSVNAAVTEYPNQ